MKKSVITVVAAILMGAFGFSATAETVSQKEASRVAQMFFNAAHGQVMGKPNLVYNGKRLTTDKLFSPFYVYNLPKGGFVIVSAENKAMPILGYSLKENFDAEDMGDGVKALLTEYARDIEYIRYDSRVPEEAISAWTHLPDYIATMLDARNDATDTLITFEDAGERIGNIEYSDRIYDLSSDIFSPDQWRDMMDEELATSKNVALGIIGGGEIYPAIVHGKKGDYYRINFNGQNDWLLRLMATEFLSSGQIADFGHPIIILEETEEEVPFSFYEDFVAETRAEQESRERKYEMSLLPSEPVVRSVGGGRFQISLPEEVVMSRIYNLNGSMVTRQEYRGTNVASVNLEGQPYGFYFALLNGASGKSYGVKLYR